MHQAIAALFAETFGAPPDEITRLTADGSQRVYFRVTGAGRPPVIGAFGPDRDENRAFLSFTRAFRGIGLPVPELFGADERKGLWLEEDLGDTTLFAALSSARALERGAFPHAMIETYERVIDILPRFQVDGGRVIDFSVAYPRPAFDRQSMLWDLNYFKYHFLKLAHVPFNEQRLENDFERLTDHLLEADTGRFLYRDFQSRNIMLRDGEPWFIDYQGGRRGAVQYDVASLLYDAKADIPEAVRERLLQRYIDALGGLSPVDAARFFDTYRGYVLIRIMQAMGAYGYRGYFERKPRFLESVPYAARNVAGLLDAGMPIALPELESVFHRIVEAWADLDRPVGAGPGLTVRVTSFSYRQGLPPDDVGHGGGFVFDCRSLPNPGRLPEFANASGRDTTVIEFLERFPEVDVFWSHVAPLVDAHIDNFRDRQFSHLSVAFGCTGGQHRSVFFAEKLARHVREHHPDVIVRLEHRERQKWGGLDGDDLADDAATGAAPPTHAALGSEDDPWRR